MKIAIMQPGYLPWLGFFDLMYHCDKFVFFDDVQYTKKDWRNRNRIRTKDGWMWLTVPVITKERRFQLISEVEINNTINWPRKHLTSLMVNYAKAPYFDMYYSELKEILSGREWKYLAEVNVALISWMAKKLGIMVPCIMSSTLGVGGEKEEHIINICRVLGASQLYDSKAAKAILNCSRITEAGISCEFQDYCHPQYQQAHRPFIPYMSVVDLLFQCGLKSLAVLLGRKEDV